MSEATIYALLAELNTLATASLRLGLGFGLLGVVALLQAWLWRSAGFAALLGRYWLAWMTAMAAMAWICTSAERLILLQFLPGENQFVLNGWYWASAMGIGGALLLGLSAGHQHRRTVLVALSLLLALFVFLPPFSRSDKIFSSAALVLPSALALSFLPWLLVRSRNVINILNEFNLLWGMAFIGSLSLYMVRFHPFLSEMPRDNDFYPFIALTNWFMVIFVIIYLGNIYIQYWLKQSKTTLHIIWCALFTSVALLLLWFNANLFDTLAL